MSEYVAQPPRCPDLESYVCPSMDGMPSLMSVCLPHAMPVLSVLGRESRQALRQRTPPSLLDTPYNGGITPTYNHQVPFTHRQPAVAHSPLSVPVAPSQTNEWCSACHPFIVTPLPLYTHTHTHTRAHYIQHITPHHTTPQPFTHRCQVTKY
mmetsp:Transcript_6031/g.17224  ORF Transcript_6031/g.17224 Transcript_6031/m.17224 type:complete len:152 (+) Transcript_6031:511-966(+)